MKDPICGMEVDPNEAMEMSEYEGETYYFCSSSCKEQFDAEPEQYALPHAEPPATQQPRSGGSR